MQRCNRAEQQYLSKNAHFKLNAKQNYWMIEEMQYHQKEGSPKCLFLLLFPAISKCNCCLNATFVRLYLQKLFLDSAIKKILICRILMDLLVTELNKIYLPFDEDSVLFLRNLVKLQYLPFLISTKSFLEFWQELLKVVVGAKT